MTALALFPSRIRFVNGDGTLTPEAYRALQEIVSRTGGVLGVQGSDTYGDILGDLSTNQASVAYTDIVQPEEKQVLLEMVVQQGTPDVAAASGSTATGVATLDFGSGKTDTSVYVADGDVTATSYIVPFVKPSTTATNTADNHIFEQLEVVAGVPGAGGFTLYGKCTAGKAYGTYTIGYTVN